MMSDADDDAKLHPGVCSQAPQTIGGGFSQRSAVVQPDVPRFDNTRRACLTLMQRG